MGKRAVRGDRIFGPWHQVSDRVEFFLCLVLEIGEGVGLVDVGFQTTLACFEQSSGVCPDGGCGHWKLLCTFPFEKRHLLSAEPRVAF